MRAGKGPNGHQLRSDHGRTESWSLARAAGREVRIDIAEQAGVGALLLRHVSKIDFDISVVSSTQETCMRESCEGTPGRVSHTAKSKLSGE